MAKAPLKESEIWEAHVKLVECPHCEAELIVRLEIAGPGAYEIVCDVCDKAFNGVYDDADT